MFCWNRNLVPSRWLLRQLSWSPWCWNWSSHGEVRPGQKGRVKRSVPHKLLWKHMGLSENSVPLHPMVNDHYPVSLGVYPIFRHTHMKTIVDYPCLLLFMYVYVCFCASWFAKYSLESPEGGLSWKSVAYQRQQHVDGNHAPPTAQGPVDVSPCSTANEAINTRPWLNDVESWSHWSPNPIISHHIPSPLRWHISEKKNPPGKVPHNEANEGIWRHWITMLNHVESSIYIYIYIHISHIYVYNIYIYICLLGPKLESQTKLLHDGWLPQDCAHLCPVQPVVFTVTSCHIYLHTCHGDPWRACATQGPQHGPSMAPAWPQHGPSMAQDPQEKLVQDPDAFHWGRGQTTVADFLMEPF